MNKRELLLAEHDKIIKTVVAKHNAIVLNIERKFKYNQDITFCKIKCKRGHIFETNKDALKLGRWCAECNKDGRISILVDGIKDIITGKDGQFINQERRKDGRFITVKCNKDQHIWTAELQSIKNGQWCWECYKTGKIKKVDYEEAANKIKEQNLILLTPAPIDYWSEIEIECVKHNWRWKTQYGTFDRGGSSCRYCGHNTPGFDEIQKILTKRNVIFVKRIINCESSIRNIILKCVKHNHEWRTNCENIMREDRWCIYCSREARKTQFPVIKKAVEDNGGTILTDNVIGSLTKFKVKCKKGHEWETYYDNINQGYWCPQCPYVQQTKLFDIIQKLYPNNKVEYNYHGFKWLKTKNGKGRLMEIDIWVPDLKLAIEYDGEQHFMPIRFSANETPKQALRALQKLKKRDAFKTKLIAAHQQYIQYFVRFTYEEEIEESIILQKLKENNIPV